MFYSVVDKQLVVRDKQLPSFHILVVNWAYKPYIHFLVWTVSTGSSGNKQTSSYMCLISGNNHTQSY